MSSRTPSRRLLFLTLALHASCSSDRQVEVAELDASSGSGGADAPGGGGASLGGATGGGGVAGAGGGSAGIAGLTGSGGNAAADAGTGRAGDHLLISEVGLLPDSSEFVEIYNPTPAEVDLSDYYLADNSAYYNLTSGPWNPEGTRETDWLVRFPDGARIPAGAVRVAALNTDFETAFGRCPYFVINTAATPLGCGAGEVPAMRIPTNGSVGDNRAAMISNFSEMIVLFTWDGNSATVKDVDYVTWGATFNASTRVDKSGVYGYAADTATEAQKPADPGLTGSNDKLSIERCALEPGEKLTGGNGITGHDETSEDFGAGFRSQDVPSPGSTSDCLP
jgi:hypothetical protein